MVNKKLVINEREGIAVPDICGMAVELINRTTAGATKVSLAKLMIDPRGKSRRHYHKKMEEIYYILSGSGRITIGDESFDIEPGCAIFLPTGMIHEILNTGEQELIFVCADAPVFDEEDVYEA